MSEKSPTQPTDATNDVPVKPLAGIGLKFAFLAAVLADPGSRNKRRPKLTAFDGAVLAWLVNRYNQDRGYSFAGVRDIAEAINASTSGVARSINKLLAEQIIVEVCGGHRNKARRLAPNWAKFIEDGVHAMAEDGAVHGIAKDAGVHGMAEAFASTAIAGDITLRNLTERKVNGTYGPAGARARPAGAGRRSASSAPITGDDILKVIREAGRC